MVRTFAGSGCSTRLADDISRTPLIVEPVPHFALFACWCPCFVPLSLRVIDLGTQALVLLVTVAAGIQLLRALLDAPNDFRQPALEPREQDWRATVARMEAAAAMRQPR